MTALAPLLRRLPQAAVLVFASVAVLRRLLSARRIPMKAAASEMRTVASETTIASETTNSSETSTPRAVRPPRKSIDPSQAMEAHAERIRAARPPPTPEPATPEKRPYVAVMRSTPKRSPGLASLRDDLTRRSTTSAIADDKAEVCDLGCKGSPGAAGLSAVDWLRNLSDEQRQVEEEWRKKLTPEEFRVLRMKGTEEIHSGEYNELMAVGTYLCKGCRQPLYVSKHKFLSGHGWPAFADNLPDALTRTGTRKVEVTCSGCDGHIGHVFKSSRYPPPKRERHCVNSISLIFEPPQTSDEAWSA
jgi:peptide-methionine (R)-S-oxide reductase